MSDGEMFAVLDDLGLAYDRRASSRGVPYAAFRLVGAAGAAETAVTALIENGVLRLTSHRIDTPAGALEIVQAASRLPLGAAYRSPEDGTAELSIGLFLGDAPLSRAIVSPLLNYLTRAGAALATGVAGLSRPALVTGFRAGSLDIRAALAPHGHALTVEGDAFRMTVPLASDLAGSIVFREDATGWITASASYVPSQRLPAGDEAILALQKLQRWTAAGRLVLDDKLVVRADVATPLLGASTARAIVWTASQSAALLQAAARHLGLPR